jgi:hypothetical protein
MDVERFKAMQQEYETCRKLCEMQLDKEEALQK